MKNLHADEVETDPSLVRRLLATQFPRWADLPIGRVPSSGTDNALYRLGDDLVARLPRVERAVPDADTDAWLPKLAPHLPLAVPEKLATGMPGDGYPWRWSIYRWLHGETITPEGLTDPLQAARDLARFVGVLEGIDATGGPLPARDRRGGPLAPRDGRVRAAIAACGDLIDARTVTAAWEDALAAPAWDGAPVWVHGDLQAGNVLGRDGHLSAVIDWGALAVGDPACDLLAAWSLFSAHARDVFRAELGSDEATWRRGRGWALSTALIALPYYLHTNPGIVANSRRKIAEVLADSAQT